jgi:hypothetical protein
MLRKLQQHPLLAGAGEVLLDAERLEACVEFVHCCHISRQSSPSRRDRQQERPVPGWPWVLVH